MSSPLQALTRFRARLGMTQSELAKRSGVALRTISSIETGKHEPEPVTIGKLAQALGLEFDELYEAIYQEAAS